MQVRHNVFETNSSSSHSLTLTPGNLITTPFPKEILREGVFKVHLGEYGWGWERFYSVANKVRYLVTHCFQEIPDGDPQEITSSLRAENKFFDLICKSVEDKTGVRIELVPGSSGYIDHESEGIASQVHAPDKLETLLWGASSFVQLGNDNDSAPFRIPTDTGFGAEDFYAASYAEPAVGAVPITLVSDDGCFELQTLNGVVVPESLTSEIQGAGVVSDCIVRQISPYPSSRYEEGLSVGEVAAFLVSIAEFGGMALRFRKQLTASLVFEKGPYSRNYELTILVPPDLASKIICYT